MKHAHRVIHSPTVQAKQLILLFHRIGDHSQTMKILGHQLAKDFQQALVVSIAVPLRCDDRHGEPGFSVQVIAEDDQTHRLSEAMPAFIETIRYWQQHSGVGYAGTALVGFAEGAVISLESVKSEPQLAGRVIAFSGRFAQLPQSHFVDCTVHLIHGSQDTTIALDHAQAAAERLQAIGGDVTLDIEEGAGHTINQGMINTALRRLRYYVPQRYWDEAGLANRSG